MSEAILDLKKSISKYRVWLTLGYYEIKTKFRRSIIGPFWLTLSMVIFIICLCLIMKSVFKQDINFIAPYVSTGLIIWTFINQTVNESTEAFTHKISEGYIKNTTIPISLLIFQLVLKNIIIMGFNSIIIIFIFFIFIKKVTIATLIIFPSLIILIIAVFFMSLLVATISARFRDIPPIIQSLFQVVFFITPVWWSAENIPNKPVFIEYNPLYHFLTIIRYPLNGNYPPFDSFIISILCLIFLILVSLKIYNRAINRIPYWL